MRAKNAIIALFLSPIFSAEINPGMACGYFVISLILISFLGS
jgi:hypothetical protein